LRLSINTSVFFFGKVSERGPLMFQALLMMHVEIIVPLAHVHEVEPFLKQCCAEAGDKLLGRRAYPESDEVLFVVQLMHDANSSKHIAVLHSALQQNIVSSFQFARGSIIEFSAPLIIEQMRDFPLTFGDAWIPSLDDPQCVYLLTHKQLMTATQAAWVLNHSEIKWQYL